MTSLEIQAAAAKSAGVLLANATTAQKNNALCAIAAALIYHQDVVLAANRQDLLIARAGGMTPAMLDRLTLTPQRIEGIADGVLQVSSLPDPIGSVLSTQTRPNGLVIEKRRVPLGLVGIIYEARPNVTVDAAVLCLKAGNAVLLRGGKEAICSNTALAEIMSDAVFTAGLPRESVTLVTDIARTSADEMMNLTDYLDVLIPR
ncbi:MAG: aldehyde dehydrogenase family protein, partial [Oscillospiraceae bacterium]